MDRSLARVPKIHADEVCSLLNLQLPMWRRVTSGDSKSLMSHKPLRSTGTKVLKHKG